MLYIEQTYCNADIKPSFLQLRRLKLYKRNDSLKAKELQQVTQDADPPSCPTFSPTSVRERLGSNGCQRVKYRASTSGESLGILKTFFFKIFIYLFEREPEREHEPQVGGWEVQEDRGRGRTLPG